MSQSNVAGWLPSLLGPVVIQSAGVPQVASPALNFIGFPIFYNPVTGALDITAPAGGGGGGGGGGGFTPPSGTGFASVTAGVLDPASVKVNLASGTYVTGTLPVANGGTGLTSLGAGVATFLGAPSSANLLAAVTDETGSGKLVFHNSPALTSPSIFASGGVYRYLFGVSALAADRYITLPLLTANDTFVFAAFAQTLTNKTISGASNTITNVSLTAGVTGTLPVANGGTNLTALISAMDSLSINWSAAAAFTKTLAAGSNTFTFGSQTAGQTIIVRLTGAASTVTWPTVKWPGGTVPTQTASGTDVYTFFYDGTTTYGSVVQAMA